MCRVSLLLLLLLGLSVAGGEELALYPSQEHLLRPPPHHQDHQGTTVCIEIRPGGQRAAPTKVCGPVVHGGQQPPEQPREVPSQHGEMKSAGEEAPPCTHPGAHPRYADGPPPPHVMMMMGGPRMTEGMMGGPRMTEGMMGGPQAMMGGPQAMMGGPQGVMGGPQGMVPSWRESPPPYEQRAVPGMPFPMPLPLMARQPGPVRWYGARQSQPEPKSAGEQPQREEMKQELKHLLTECEEKTQQIKEKDLKIEQLMAQVEDTKRSTTPEKPLTPPQTPNKQPSKNS